MFDLQLRRQTERRFARGGIRSKDVALLTRQLATLAQAGLPVLQAFELAERSARTVAMATLIQDIHQRVEHGASLQHAFSQHPRHFDALYCASLGSAEASGALGRVLIDLAQHLEKGQALRAKVRAALTYPSVLALVTLLTVIAIMVFMVPAFEQQFADFGAPLPALTQVVIGMSRALAEHGASLALGMSLSAAWGVRIWRRGGAGRVRMMGLVLRLPGIGSLMQHAHTARWARALANLTGSGVPLFDALTLIGQAAGHSPVMQACKGLALAIDQGSSLASAMQASQAFPDLVVHMCALGEASGTLDLMLARSAEMLEGEVDESVAQLSSLLEPIMLLVLGTVIGGILLAMYLPIFQLGRVI